MTWLKLVEFLEAYMLLERGQYDEFSQTINNLEHSISPLEFKYLKITYFIKLGNRDEAINYFKAIREPEFSFDEIQALKSKLLGVSVFDDDKKNIENMIAEGNDHWDGFDKIGLVFKLAHGDFLLYCAIFYQINGKFDLAEKYYLEQLQLEEEIGISLRLGKGKNNLSSLYLDLGDTISALSLIYEVKELYIKENANHLLSQTYGIISEIYSVKGDFESAIFYADLSKNILDEIGTEVEKIMIRVFLIRFYFELNHNPSAKKELDEVLKLIEESTKSRSNTMFARIYLPLIEFLVPIDIELAKNILNDFAALVESTGELHEVSNRYKLAEAMINFQANRLHDKIKVHESLKSIVEDPEGDYPIKSLSMLYYCDFLFFEFRLMHDYSILDELEIHRNTIKSWALSNNSDILYLKSKLILIQLLCYKKEFDTALEIMGESLLYASEKGVTSVYNSLARKESTLISFISDPDNYTSYDLIESIVRFDFGDHIKRELKINNIFLVDQFDEIHTIHENTGLTPSRIQIEKLKGNTGEYYIDIIEDKYLLVKKDGGYPWTGFIFTGDVEKAINLLSNFKDLIFLHQNYYPEKSEYRLILRDIEESGIFDENYEPEETIFIPKTEVGEITQYKLMLNPYRISIMNAIVRNFNLTRSSLEEIIGGNRGTFASHLTKLIDEGLVDSETQFINGQPRVTIHVNQKGLSYYKQFKELISNI